MVIGFEEEEEEDEKEEDVLAPRLSVRGLAGETERGWEAEEEIGGRLASPPPPPPPPPSRYR